MPLFSLVIKTKSIEVALAFVENRGLKVESQPKATAPDVANITVLANGATEDVMRWFCEDNFKAPFAVGSLLLYREVEPSLARSTRRPHINREVEQPDLR